MALASTGATAANITTATTGNSVSKATPTLSITSASSATAGGSVNLTASSGAASGSVSASTGAITYSSSDPGVVSITGTTANALVAGTATITASQASDANYNSQTATQSFTVNAPAGSITPSTSSLAALSSTSYGTPSAAASFTVSASGLTGNLSVTPPSGFEVSTSEGSGYAGSLTLTPTGGNIDPAVTVYIRLAETTPPGNYSGNINVSGDGASSQFISVASSTVIKADQTITFGSLANVTFGGAAFALGATANSGLPVSYSSSNPLVATVSENTVTIVGAGTTTITASQAGNPNFNAATSVDQTLTVNKANQTITFGALPLKSSTDVAFSLGATATSGLSVGYTSSNLGVATVAGNTVTIVGAGSTTITASQAGNNNFNAASPVSQSLTVRSTIAKWTFDTLTGTTTATSTANLSADIGAGTGVGVHAASSTWNFVSGNGSTAALSANTWATSDYFQFTVNASAYEDIFIQWDQARSGTGPTSFKLQYSTDGSTFTDVPGATALSINITGTGGSFIYSDGTTGNSWSTTKYATNAGFAIDLSSISALDKQSTLVFRIVSNVTPASGGTSRIDNVTISGVGVPTISTSGSLGGLTSTYGVASAATSFSVSGLFMAAGVTVTPPPGFEVSTTSNFSLNVGDASNPLVVGGAGTLNATDVYVRLKATTLPGTYSGNIVLTSTGATQVNVATVSSTMGYASIDGSSLGLSFPGATPANRVTEFIGWTSNNPQGSDGFTYINGDTNNPIPYIGNWVSTTPNVELAYQFSRGGSEKIVFEWEQQITESVDFPGVDSFGWAFRNGTTNLFSFRFLPEQVVENDSAWVDWDENGVRAAPNQLVAVAFLGDDLPSGGPGAGPLDQVNFATFDRGQTVKFRITIDLEAKSWSADVDQDGTWFGLVMESALPAGITSVDRMVALWDIRDQTVTDGLYQSGGDNLMLFDNFAVAGSDLARTSVTLTLAAPTAPVTYDGSGKAATATANPNVAFEISYWDTISTNSTTAAPVNAGTYTAKVTVVDEVTYAATPQYVTYTIAPKPVTVSNVSANNKEYDGNTSATLNTLGADIVGRVGIDDVNLAGTASGVFTDKNVGTNIPVTVTGFTLTGNAAGNYSLTQPIPEADITAREVTVLGAVANSKTYDRTNTATINLTGATLDGVVSPDVVTVSGGGTFVSSDAGPMIAVTANLSLGGANAGNYTLSQPIYLAADIDVRALTIPDALAQDKVYDGSTDAVITGTLTGVLEGDTVTVGGGGQFASFDAGVGIAVTSYLLLEGGSAGNYSLTQPTGLTANIDPQPISVTLNPPASFTYDGSAKDYFVESSGIIADVAYQGRNGTTYGPTFVAPVNAGDYTVTATLSGNYSGSATEDFTIFKADQTITGVDATVGKTFGDDPYSLFAVVDSLLIPSFSSSNTGVATVDEFGQVTIVGAGTTTITVSQAGNNNYNAASSVTQTLTVAKATPSIFWMDPAPISYGTPLSVTELNASSSVDGSFSYSPTNGTVLNAGTNTLTAVFTAANTNNYVSPLTNTVSLVVNKALQTITFPALTDGTVGGSTTLMATSSSGLTVSYTSSDTSVAMVSGTTLNFVGAGSVTITASQAGDSNYEAATDATRSITVLSADGPWDIWADSYGLANGTPRTQLADPDGDGFVNALEFAFGTSPVAPNGQVFVSHTKVGSNYVVTFKKRKVASEVTYDIRQSTDLKQTFGSGTTMTQGSVTSVDANYDQTTVTLPISGSRGFVRMQATVNVTPSR